MSNRFFQSAMKQARRLAGKPERIAHILSALAFKISRVDWSVEGRVKLKLQTMLMGRLLRANLTGAYSLKSKRMLAGLLAACIYFINPFDLIPDLLAGVGLADDLAIIAWVSSAVAAELQAFEAWEKTTSASL